MEYKTELGLCRFCQSEGQHRDIMKEYSVNGKRENYSDILLDCFNIFISISVSSSALICAQCVENLCAARAFRELLLGAEQALSAMDARSILLEVPAITDPVTVKTEPALKAEPSDDVVVLECERIGNNVKQESADSPAEVKPVKRKPKRVVMYPCKMKSQDTPIITKSTHTYAFRTLRTFQCLYCGEVFSVPSALNAHQALEHRVGRKRKVAGP